MKLVEQLYQASPGNPSSQGLDCALTPGKQHYRYDRTLVVSACAQWAKVQNPARVGSSFLVAGVLHTSPAAALSCKLPCGLDASPSRWHWRSGAVAVLRRHRHEVGGSNWRLKLWGSPLPAPRVMWWESGLTFSGSLHLREALRLTQ